MIYTVSSGSSAYGISTVRVNSLLDPSTPRLLYLQKAQERDLFPRRWRYAPRNGWSLALSSAQADVIDEGGTLTVVWLRPSVCLWWAALLGALLLAVAPLLSLGSLPSAPLLGVALALFLLALAVAQRWIIAPRLLTGQVFDWLAYGAWLGFLAVAAPALIRLAPHAPTWERLGAGTLVFLSAMYLVSVARLAFQDSEVLEANVLFR